jgi:lambda repressor-like predicted transcriptional regulator
MQNINGTWLKQKLAQNGFTFADLSEQTGISVSDLENIADTEQASQEQWDVILDTLNNYPDIRYPAADILDDLDADIQSAGDEGSCIVFYGVSDHSIVFTGYQNLADLAYHGSGSIDQQYVSQLNTTLGDAKTLFARQNVTISQ